MNKIFLVVLFICLVCFTSCSKENISSTVNSLASSAEDLINKIDPSTVDSWAESANNLVNNLTESANNLVNNLNSTYDF